jgi:hypothetical protein
VVQGVVAVKLLWLWLSFNGAVIAYLIGWIVWRELDWRLRRAWKGKRGGYVDMRRWAQK